MFINIQVDKLEMEALQKAGTEIQGLVTMMAKGFGEKADTKGFKIPTKRINKSKKFGNITLDLSPEALNLAITVEPKFTADVLALYTKAYGTVAIPVAQFIIALTMANEQMEAARNELNEKWLTEPKKEKGSKKAA
jgi:hypothetical protein